MLKKLFLLLFLIGLLYTGSCVYRAYRYFVPAESGHSERRWKLDTEIPPPLAETRSDNGAGDPG